MKKFLTVWILTIVILALAACGTANGNIKTYRIDGNTLTASVVSASDYDETLTAIVGHSGYDNDFQDHAELVKTFEDFKIFLAKPELASSSDELKRHMDKYGEEYFSGNYLVFIADWQPSGSNSLAIEKIESLGGGIIEVTSRVKRPEIGTCDMKLWIFLIEIPADINLESVEYRTLT